MAGSFHVRRAIPVDAPHPKKGCLVHVMSSCDVVHVTYEYDIYILIYIYDLMT